ncbi:hypothetical protein TSOC_006864 [Tetrabaena socialis]|uniref:Uncharacterized protein n=1 Tax=Tetrabaena socialis TaxID=47790 RepID=A0A2J8A2I1_9CHLO|nr:hypothetical protein TSOC_006864 [Tetrabaena socialis]|eukprot:PNH06729.1 hypothetical protein TSOC_006864 [Tetrabaena socialis]
MEAERRVLAGPQLPTCNDSVALDEAEAARPRVEADVVAATTRLEAAQARAKEEADAYRALRERALGARLFTGALLPGTMEEAVEARKALDEAEAARPHVEADVVAATTRLEAAQARAKEEVDAWRAENAPSRLAGARNKGRAHDEAVGSDGTRAPRRAAAL